MGIINTKKDLPQVLVIGPEASGKTLLIYKEKLKNYNKD
jgi:GTPase SAR1 family protein